MSSSGGGAFLPGDPPPSTGQVITNPTLVGATLTTATLTAPTVTTPTMTAPVISGAATIATGATITTPTILLTASSVTATGATGSAATALSAVTPAIVVATGASGAGLGLPTGAAVAGSLYIIQNAMTGAVNIYAVGGTINGTTGTTAFPLTATGNLQATVVCVSAGAWRIAGNT